MKKTIFLIVMLFLVHSSAVIAEEKSGHFKGKPSETLEEAVRNFSEYNKKLSKILSQDSLSPMDMQQVHELTYTLEDALEKINTTMTELAETLENVHVGSETGDVETTQKEGAHYLETARQIIK